VLRGGLDGLAALAPMGDPAYVGARNGLALSRSGDNGALALDSMYALHPRLKTLHALYGAGELLGVQACVLPYQDRSHFDAQNVLETGGDKPFTRTTGWLNAALQALPGAPARRELGLAMAAQAPLVLQGPTRVATWSPSPLPDVSTDTLERLAMLYGERDPALAAALEGARDANMMAGEVNETIRQGGRYGGRALAPMARAAATFLAQPNGPVACVLEMGGWDTHANQGVETGTLSNALGVLDEGVATLKEGLGQTWRDTLVVIVTEFGRTVAANGNRGTDHGTGMAAFLTGGAAQGGRILADWPGLGAGQLNDARDLRGTTDLRAVLKGALSDHWRISAQVLNTSVFPGSEAIKPLTGLIRA
jgi:uncharacterized protein (DUF1501 family)